MTAQKQDAKADLLPCPFCGGQPGVIERGAAGVRCSRGHHVCVYGPNRAEAIAAWNRRASPKGCDVELREDADTLAVLLDNLVIAQTLSRELRDRALDEARSYIYGRRLALTNQARQPEGADALTLKLLDAVMCAGSIMTSAAALVRQGKPLTEYASRIEEVDVILRDALDGRATDNADGLSDDLVAVPRRVFSDFLNNQPGWPDTARRYMAAPAIGRPPAGKDLAGEVERLRAALEPFARLPVPERPVGNAGTYLILHDDIRQALAALGEGE